jgi:hypothetical protein
MSNKHKNKLDIQLVLDDDLHYVFLIQSHVSGSNNRQWSARYKNMIQKWQFLKETAKTKEDMIELRGYELCLKNFYVLKGLTDEQ